MINAIIYIAATLAANYTATWFIHFPVFGQVSVATFIFGITFTQRDRVHNKLGRKNVYVMIGVAALLNLAVTILGAVEWRIILASFIAIILAETADTEIYQYYINNTWGLRVLKSNAVSIPLDSLLFNTIAFAGVFTQWEIASIIFGEIVFKGIVSAVAALRPIEYFKTKTAR
ncbi:MAG: VUT family protein [Ignavibacteriales bacterium]|nr:VUT family protein [Ignavibacteriales bacterium]